MTIENYLQDIAPENICGSDIEYDSEFIALEQAIQGKPEQQIGNLIQEAEPPNWREILQSSEKLLGRTKDLRILIYYLRALLASSGFSGFNQGLALIKALLEKYWDSIHPQLDPEDDHDPTLRINILTALCDFDTMLSALQTTVLVESKALGRFSLRDLNIAEGKQPPPKNATDLPNLSTIDGAFQECDPERLQSTQQAVSSSLEAVNAIESFLTAKVGINQAPSFDKLRVLLKEINGILNTWVERRGLRDADAATDSTDPASANELTVTSKPVVQAVSTGIHSNQDVLKALNQICDYYKKNEPSSPIPLLIERVTRLVGKNFMDVLKDLAPNGVEQIEFLRGNTDKD